MRYRMSQGDSNPAAIPHAAEDIQGDDRWMSQHNRFVLDCKDKEPDVLFVGDSMVQLMQQYEIWRELFSPLHALNFGIGGDTTGHVLWRLKNGELENIKPKVIVVWVGTNNHENTAEEVAGGIEAIVQLINTRQPQAKIIVLQPDDQPHFLESSNVGSMTWPQGAGAGPASISWSGWGNGKWLNTSGRKSCPFSQNSSPTLDSSSG
ncbi:platelet-activating factor acetylhydrolase IB subunit beta isoform X3 [Myotis lucifugus]|uniref:platelet-activating factor acetylhydrolase IB subunit beta isoform X3 n=1 Tax=Myotis lucifugus TaxID=59463 RepID=UPI000CCBE7B1|nr:platelet-activating factor acetylhydrolase IB subunit beta isoform X3 [Myotis lucifugus]